jgi:hypothetical protein
MPPIFRKLCAEYILFGQNFFRNLAYKRAIACTDFDQFAVRAKIPS